MNMLASIYERETRAVPTVYVDNNLGPLARDSLCITEPNFIKLRKLGYKADVLHTAHILVSLMVLFPHISSLVPSLRISQNTFPS